MKLTSILTAVVAVYGALLSSATLFMHLRSKRWRLIITYGLGPKVLSVRAANLGERSIALAHFWIDAVPKRSVLKKLIDDSKLFFGLRVYWYGTFSPSWLKANHIEFPTILEPGRSCTIKLDFIRQHGNEFRSLGSSHIVGHFQDETGKSYRGEPLVIDYQAQQIYSRLPWA